MLSLLFQLNIYDHRTLSLICLLGLGVYTVMIYGSSKSDTILYFEVVCYICTTFKWKVDFDKTDHIDDILVLEVELSSLPYLIAYHHRERQAPFLKFMIK